jgi:acetyl-CoA carboxylase carboxyltransferase component
MFSMQLRKTDDIQWHKIKRLNTVVVWGGGGAKYTEQFRSVVLNSPFFDQFYVYSNVSPEYSSVQNQ